MAYVYRHIRLDKNEPFYIGIGSDSRYKRANERTRRNQMWKRIVAKTNYDIEILFDDISWGHAKEKEIEFISLYGRKDNGTGILSNMSDGGDGELNKVFTPEYRRKLSEANKNRIISESQKEKLRKYRLGKPSWNKGITGNKSHLYGRKQTELTKQRNSLSKSGDKNPMYGVIGKNSATFKGYVMVFKDDIFVGEYDGVNSCARELNLTATKISACLNGRRNKTGGYTFKRIPKCQDSK